MPALFDRQQIYGRFLKPQVRHTTWPTHCTAPTVNTARRPLPPSPHRVCGPPPLSGPCFPPLGPAGLKRCPAVYLWRVHRGSTAGEPSKTNTAAHAFPVGRRPQMFINTVGVYAPPIHFSIHFTPDRSGYGLKKKKKIFPLPFNVRTQ